MLVTDTVLQERYRIIRQLGQGGMGAVYAAIDERLDKTVAIKEVLFELENNTEKNRRANIKKAFRREAKSLVKAKHHTVPDVTDYFSEKNRQFLVMEYIEGDDLAKMLSDRNQSFPLKEVLPWVNQLLEALKYLHSLKPPIIHRDIKPQNLKLNQWNNIKLLDFGIARNTDKSSTQTANTFLGATLNYSPIEQVLRVIDPTFREFILLQHRAKVEKILAQDTDARCDLFALGATIYHLLTNEPPVDITRRALGIWEKQTDPLKTPSEINPDIPLPVSNWIMKAMSFERAERFPTALEMQNSFNKAFAEKNKKSEVTRSLTDQTLPATTNVNFGKQRPDSANVHKQSQTKSANISNTLPSPTQPAHTQAEVITENKETVQKNNPVTEKNVSTKTFNDFNLRLLKTNQPGSKRSMLFLLIPVIGILSLVVLGGGLFGLTKLINSSEPTANTNTFDIENETTNSNRENESIAIESNSNTDTSNIINNQNTIQTSSKPSVKKTPGMIINKTPTPKKTTKTIKRTPPQSTSPKRTPTRKPAKDPSCVYTNSC
jgi:serine/threonine protein kinase